MFDWFDDLIYSDCDTCRAVRLGIFLGAIASPVLTALFVVWFG